MNRDPISHSSIRNRMVTLAITAGTLLSQTVFGQTIPNPSFEADTFTVSPGYISGNAPITGWTANQEANAGLNPAGGNPFADNGAVPDGNNVGFIQSAGAGTTLSTTLSGLTVGTMYKLTFRANASTGQTPNLRISVDNQELLAVTVYSVGGVAPYAYLAFDFTAAAASQTLTLLNDASGDNTVVVDDFRIAPSSGRWVVAPWTGDSDSGVDANFVYTHAYRFGSDANVTINGVLFTGIPGVNPAVPAQFSTTFLGNLFNNDANNIGGNSATLAHDFVYGGTVPAGSFQSITLNGLTPGTEYVATLYSVGWEAPASTIRWATFSVGEDRLTINQDQFGDNNGIIISYRYTADASGTVILKYAPVNPLNVSIHTYGFSNREALSRNVAPTILVQPKAVIVAEGQSATFSVTAQGIPAPTYQWRLGGVDFSGETSASLSIGQVFSVDAGSIDVVVSNSQGSVTSAVARLIVGLAMINPSFEADTFSVSPGYVSGNGPITGWSALGGHGINPGVGFSPFADNGTIPHGSQVAFLQQDGAFSQVVSGFNPGSQYYLHYYENARTVVTIPSLAVTLDGNPLVAAHPVPPVGGSNPYHETYSDVFAATAASHEIAFVKSSPQAGDSTALIDNFAVVEVPAGTAPFISLDPQPRIVSIGDSLAFTAQGIGSLPLSYQWLKNGAEISGAISPTLPLNDVQKQAEGDYSVRVSNGIGTATSGAARLTVFEPIPDLYNTGVDNDRMALADNSTDPHYQLIDNPDTGSLNAIVEDSTAFPIVAGPWLANTSGSKWIGPQFNTAASAVGFYTYRTVIDLEDRDPSTLVILGQWSTDNAGRDIRVNGVSTGNIENPGFNVYTPFAIYGTNVNFVAGSNAIDFIVENVATIGYTGLRVEILASNLRIPAGIPPEITTQPIDGKIAEGDSYTFVVAASGTSPLSFQWQKNGVALPGQNGLTLTISNVMRADSGFYSAIVSNSAGVVVSRNAYLCACWQVIPGIFGTGVDDNGALLSAGATDPHYALIASADAGAPGPSAFVLPEGFPIPPWVSNGPKSKWIAPTADQSVGSAEGEYTYETTIDLSGIDVSQVTLSGAWAVDNVGLDIVVNGVSTGITNGGFGGLTPFTISSGLVAGSNTLDFRMSNLPATPNPTGIRVDLRGLLNTQPKLQIAQQPDKTVQVAWAPTNATDRLQSAPTILGPWTDFANQQNPQSIIPCTHTVLIDADQEAQPPGARTGSGSGALTLSGTALTLNNITYSGLSANSTAAHIHGPAVPGQPAGILYSLDGLTTLGSTAGVFNGTITLVNGTSGFTIEQQLAQLSGGQWYINIHSTAFGSGEIRGQILPYCAQFFRVVAQ